MSILITCDPIPLDQARGFVVKYLVQVSEPSGTHCNPNTVQSPFLTVYNASNSCKLTLNDLDPRKPYCVSTAAATTVGSGPSTNLQFVPCEPENKMKTEHSHCISIYVDLRMQVTTAWQYSQAAYTCMHGMSYTATPDMQNNIARSMAMFYKINQCF